tara:strand:- start:1399 stop:2523 length:1125 start_codon:yes stop_codon:yes gene_type:complete
MAINKKRKRGPSLDDKYLGPEPIFTEESEFTDRNWTKAAGWYNYFYKTKDYMPSTYQFAIDCCGFDKKKVQVLKRQKDYRFMSVNKLIKLYYRGWVYSDEQLDNIKKFINEQYKIALKLKKVEDAQKKTVVVISPAERTRRKVLDTIYHDWDTEIVEGWLEGNYTQKFSAYNRWKMHGLKGNAINMFKALLDAEYDNIKAAYDKSCSQCVEAYSQYTKGEKRKILKQFEEVYEDLDRLRLSFKALKTPRTRKTKSSDAQVARLQYCAEDIDAKLTSINPIMIPGKHKLFVYNKKQRKLMEYTTTAIDGFVISGTSIKNFDKTSRAATLRKPDEMLPMILNKTEKQIEKLWETITTKITKPTGRINSDCILMRTF